MAKISLVKKKKKVNLERVGLGEQSPSRFWAWVSQTGGECSDKGQRGLAVDT